MSQFADPPMDPATSMVTRGKGCAAWFVRDGRLRSGWRVTVYTIIARLGDLVGLIGLGILIALTIGGVLILQGVPLADLGRRISAYFVNLSDHPWILFLFQVERLVLVLAFVWLFRRFVDKRSFLSLGFSLSPGWRRQALAGFAYSMAGWAAIFVLSLTLSAATITGFEWATGNWAGVAGGLLYGLLLNIAVGVAEETDARGYVLQNLAEGIRFWPAVLVSSLYFGLLHLLNPGAGVTSTLGIFFAGVLLALGYYATGRLWFSIGMHAGWNFAEGPIFGFLVSGLNMGGLFRLQITGPDWLMGGAFGPEAGVLAVVVEVVMILVLLGWVRTRQVESKLKTGTG